MSFQTIIGQKLELVIQQELLRMTNEWFFKWHFIGSDGPSVEIESFRGSPICYDGLAYSGTPVMVFWDTISRYRKIKVSELFDLVELQLPKYSKHIREQSIVEASRLIKMFASSIQRQAIEKDRILRGDGISFPQAHDQGRWGESNYRTIDIRADGLVASYCDIESENGGLYVVERMMKEDLSFVKADGTGQKDGIKGLVTKGTVITFDVSLPVQPEDRFLRKLPSGLVEEYIVNDPGYQGGIGGAIKPHFQAKVRRSDAPATTTRTIINNIQGDNSRVNIDSVDNSQNLAASSSSDEIFQQLRERLGAAKVQEGERTKMLEAIDEMEAVKGTDSFKDKYKSFMSAASDHAGVFGTLLAGLAMLI